MTYSLNTLNNPSRSGEVSARTGWSRFANELVLIAGLTLLAFWSLALLSYSQQDAAWSTSGMGGALSNRGGRLGAWLADGSYFLFGFSVWWCFAAGVRAWLAALARWLRSPELLHAPAQPESSRLARFAASRTGFWLGLALLMCASAVIEWSRFYSVEARLPGHGGGVLGYLVGPLRKSVV